MDGKPQTGPQIGIVIIGRNEGRRLLACLASAGAGRAIVSVDSGSTDGSAVAARGLGAEVVALDMSLPFTAARARNAGFARLMEIASPAYVQFVDGDCELAPSWIETAASFLEANSDYAVACGRRREKFPEASLFNRQCDREWTTPVGEAEACGGDALMRVAAFEAARRLAIWRGAFMASASFAGFSAIALIVWVGGRAVAAGEMTGGDLAAFMLYTTIVAVALGSEEAGELARHFGKRHPSDRMRLTAWRALAGAAPDREGRDAIWREAEAAGSRAVAAVAKLRRG